MIGTTGGSQNSLNWTNVGFSTNDVSLVTHGSCWDTGLTYLPCGLWGNETVRPVLFYRGTDKDAEGNVLSDLQSQGEIPQRQTSGRCLIASKAKLHPPIASAYFSPSARRSHLRLGSTFDLGSLTTEPVIRSVHKSIPIEVCGVRLARTLTVRCFCPFP